MVQVLMISIFGQFSGNGLGYFNTVIFEQLGVNTVAKQLGYNLLNQCISAFCALCAASLTDRMPRRAILPWGTLCCALMLGLNAGLSKVMDDQQHKFPDGSHNPAGDSSFNLSIGKAALAFYFLFNCIYSFTYTPLQGVIPVESLTTTMRAKGLAASGFIVSAIGFINQFAGPIGLQNLGYKYIWVFVGWDCVEVSTYCHRHLLSGPMADIYRPSVGTSSVSSTRATRSRSSTGSTPSPTPSRLPSSTVAPSALPTSSTKRCSQLWATLLPTTITF
jgi:hypothetical protein